MTFSSRHRARMESCRCEDYSWTLLDPCGLSALSGAVSVTLAPRTDARGKVLDDTPDI